MYFESQQHPTIIHVLTIACFVIAFLLFGMSGMAYPLIYQLSGLVLLVAGVYLLVRYILKKYRYEIAPGNIVDSYGDPVLGLVITETTGRRTTVVAKINLRDIEQIAVVDKRQDKESAKAQIADITQKYIVYRYTNTPFLSHICYIQVPCENSVLVIPYHQDMVQALRRGMDDSQLH